MNDADIMVTMRHVRQAQMCSRGIRIFAARHGFDMRSFLLEGISADKLIATGDAMALQAVEAARVEASNGRQ